MKSRHHSATARPARVRHTLGTERPVPKPTLRAPSLRKATRATGRRTALAVPAFVPCAADAAVFTANTETVPGLAFTRILARQTGPAQSPCPAYHGCREVTR